MSTSGIAQGVQWVPGMQDFLVNWSSDLKLYKISVMTRIPHSQNEDGSYIVNCPALKSELKCRITETPHYTKCISACPILTSTSSSPNRSPNTASNANTDVKVAVGQANGRISLLSFMNSSNSGGGVALKEFGPKTGSVDYR
jgi:hypothetical protein